MLFSFDNRGYAPLIVRILASGDKYGLNNALTADKPMVEFFDARYPIDELTWYLRAQFVSRYYLSTMKEGLVKGGTIHGLDLDGGVPAWTANGETMRGLSAILSHLIIA